MAMIIHSNISNHCSPLATHYWFILENNTIAFRYRTTRSSALDESVNCKFHSIDQHHIKSSIIHFQVS